MFEEKIGTDTNICMNFCLLLIVGREIGVLVRGLT